MTSSLHPLSRTPEVWTSRVLSVSESKEKTMGSGSSLKSWWYAKMSLEEAFLDFGGFSAVTVIFYIIDLRSRTF